MLCHSVRSCHSPLLSLKRSLVARLNLATAVPLGVNLTSGSLPRFPRRMTLLTLFMRSVPSFFRLALRLGLSNRGIRLSPIIRLGFLPLYAAPDDLSKQNSDPGPINLVEH